MVEQLDRMIHEVYLQELNSRQVKLKLLQFQINPHFLFNCLNSVYQMSMHEGNEKTAQMALYLGKYFRYATSVDLDVVTLKSEIENIQTYIEIQKYVFRIG